MIGLQGFQWTRWRIMVGAGVAVAIVIALAVAFSHPSSKLHHSDVTGYAQGAHATTPGSVILPGCQTCACLAGCRFSGSNLCTDATPSIAWAC